MKQNKKLTKAGMKYKDKSIYTQKHTYKDRDKETDTYTGI